MDGDNLMIEELGWVCMPLSIIGALLNAKLNKWGFIFYIVANIGWIIIDIWYELWAQIPVWVVFICIGVYGFISWGKKDLGEKNLQKG